MLRQTATSRDEVRNKEGRRVAAESRSEKRQVVSPTSADGLAFAWDVWCLICFNAKAFLG